MGGNYSYNGNLTAEQFLFYEIRIASKMYLEGINIHEAIEMATKDNLFQYPTERQVSRMMQACYRRIYALDNQTLVHHLAYAPNVAAKQINLYAIMRYNRLVREFMVLVIGDKFRCQDFSFSRADVNSFFTRLQSLDDLVASWSEQTISKIKSVLIRILLETEYIDSIKNSSLNPVVLCEELEEGIIANNDLCALPAFNCFR